VLIRPRSRSGAGFSTRSQAVTSTAFHHLRDGGPIKTQRARAHRDVAGTRDRPFSAVIANNAELPVLDPLEDRQLEIGVAAGQERQAW
jgi:hypothetical protein